MQDTVSCRLTATDRNGRRIKAVTVSGTNHMDANRDKAAAWDKLAAELKAEFPDGNWYIFANWSN